MARVLIKSQAWGVVFTPGPPVQPASGTLVSIKNTDGSAATLWSAQTGGTSTTTDQTTNTSGEIASKYIEEGEYDVIVNAVTTRVQAVSAQPVGTLNAKRYNAKGDNAADDTAALQAAADDASALAALIGGRVGVWLPPGTYIVSSIAPKSNVEIVGPGAILKHKTGATNPLIYQPQTPRTSVSNFRVSGVKFQGQGNTPGSTTVTNIAAVMLNNATDVRVKDCDVDSFQEQAFGFYDCLRVWCTGNKVTNCCHSSGRNAIDFAQTPQYVANDPIGDWFVTDNFIDTVTTAGIATVQTQSSRHRVVIADNIVKNCVEFAGIVCEAGYARDIAITGNNVEGCKTGIAVTETGNYSGSDDALSQVTITGNRVDAKSLAAASGISCDASNAVITGNFVRATANCLFGSGKSSAPARTPHDVLIANNLLVFAGTGTAAVLANLSLIKNLTVRGNSFIVEAGATASSHGLLIQDASGALKVENNLVIGVNYHGISISGTPADTVVAGNDVYDPNTGTNADGAGINMAQTSGNPIVRDNVCRDRRGGGAKMKYGLKRSGVNEPKLIGNDFSGYVTAAVDSITNNMRVSGNSFPPPAHVWRPVTGSPWTYTASFPEVMYVEKGTVSLIELNGAELFTQTGATILLEPGDQVRITYTVDPVPFTRCR